MSQGGSGKEQRKGHLRLVSEPSILEEVERVMEAGPALRALGLPRRAELLGRAAQVLADSSSALGGEARALLPGATGLHPAMVEWGLETAVRPATPEALAALGHNLGGPEPGRAMAVPPRLVTVVLAGNVFTASLRALYLPLLVGAPVVAKASSKDDALPRLLARALETEAPEIASALALFTFGGDEDELTDQLLTRADAVAVYGSDTTLAKVRARLPGTTRFIAHGHGLGAIYVPAAALKNADAARHLARAAALDVAAYDQRGCLSPHVLFVERGAHIDAPTFAETLSRDGLSPLASSLPRGPLPRAIATAQVQWRGVGAARGALFEGDGFATTYEGDGPIRVSPGYRNVSVMDCEGTEDLASRLLPLGVHLKALGVAGPQEVRHAVATSLPPPLAPRVCVVGAMQTPPLDSLADGESAWSGLVRWRSLD